MSNASPTLFATLRPLLERRLAVIADHELRDRDPAEQLRQLQEVSEQLDAEQSRLGNDAPIRLQHFLKQSSYSKALDWIREQQE